MQTRISLLVGFAIILILFPIPVAAQAYLYDNGPTNGTTDGWTVSFGFAVSDTFALNSDAEATGLQFAAWLEPGDTLESAEVSITSSELGGTTYFDQAISFTQSGCVSNQYGFDVCTETGYFNIYLNAGTYWLNLQNASTVEGNPVYWDENSGPSSASDNVFGTIPSESFSLLGVCGAGKNSPDCGPPPAPEPGSFLLFGSGVFGVAALLRLKMPALVFCRRMNGCYV